jgi:hypothetical protein
MYIVKVVKYFSYLDNALIGIPSTHFKNEEQWRENNENYFGNFFCEIFFFSEFEFPQRRIVSKVEKNETNQFLGCLLAAVADGFP